MTEYEKLCETTLLNQEALVRELRYQAAVAGPHGDEFAERSNTMRLSWIKSVQPSCTQLLILKLRGK